MVDEHLISLQPGTIIAGRYEVIKCLGSGNMGLVYACRHRELSGHTVAVKVLFPEVAQDKIAAARFRNEIFASYGVSHPNVVRAYEYLREGELLAYTMEYVSGGDLADRLGNREKLIPITEVIRILLEMSAGLQAIHDAGIVHRDMKPENILLTKDGHVKIADFGIARTGTGPRLTEHGGVVGTIEYVSPEYMLNSQVDWRSDIYALGIIGYEMITGEAAFQGESVYATMTKKLKVDPEPPSNKRRECPVAFDKIILKAMTRDPEKRYQSAAEIFQDLQALEIGDTKNSSGLMQRPPVVASTYVGPTLLTEAKPKAAPKPAVDLVSISSSSESMPNSNSRQNRSTGYVPSSEANMPTGSDTSSKRKSDQWTAPDMQSKRTTRNSGSQENLSGLEQDGENKRWIKPQSRTSSSHVRNQEVENTTEDYKQESDSNIRSIILDLLTLVVAVVLGVGLGFMVLRALFPDLLDSKSEGVVELVN
jgi:serine/threonine protein kinase